MYKDCELMLSNLNIIINSEIKRLDNVETYFNKCLQTKKDVECDYIKQAMVEINKDIKYYSDEYEKYHTKCKKYYSKGGCPLTNQRVARNDGL